MADSNQVMAIDMDSSETIAPNVAAMDQEVLMDSADTNGSNISSSDPLRINECLIDSTGDYNVDGQYEDIQISNNVHNSIKEDVVSMSNDDIEMDIGTTNSGNHFVDKCYSNIDTNTNAVVESNVDVDPDNIRTIQQNSQEAVIVDNLENVHGNDASKTEECSQSKPANSTFNENIQISEDGERNAIPVLNNAVINQEKSIDNVEFADVVVDKCFNQNTLETIDLIELSDSETPDSDNIDNVEISSDSEDSENQMNTTMSLEQIDTGDHSNLSQVSSSSMENDENIEYLKVDALLEVEPYSDIRSSFDNNSIESIHPDVDSDGHALDISQDNDEVTIDDYKSDLNVEDQSVGNFDGRLLLITDRKQLENNEILTYKGKVKENAENIQCGLCLRPFEDDTEWKMHLVDHYGVGWKVGEKEININDFNTVLRFVMAYYNSVASNGIKCRICRKVVRSAMGLLTHLRYCGTVCDSITCIYCEREYSKFAITSHQLSCIKQYHPNGVHSAKVGSRTNSVQNLSKSNSKQKSMKHSMPENLNKIIRYNSPFNVDKFVSEMKTDKIFCPKHQCSFIGSSVDDLNKHLLDSGHTPIDGFVCVKCTDGETFSTERVAQAHVLNCHQHEHNTLSTKCCFSKKIRKDDSNSSQISDNYGDVPTTNIPNHAQMTKKVKANKKAVQRMKKVFCPRSHTLDQDVLKLWLQFVNQHYSQKPLFTMDKMSTYTVIGSFADLDIADILPKEKKSIKFTSSADCNAFNQLTGNSDINIDLLQSSCTQLNTFQLQRTNENIFSFVGAAVTFVRWIPLPNDVSEQYLLVCFENRDFTQNDENEPVEVSLYPTSLLVYKLTHIKGDLPDLQLHYGFMISDGPIYDADFLPSGGYNPINNRLGLVAVATISSTVSVYALPINIDCIPKIYNIDFSHVVMIKINPSFLLSLTLRNEKWKTTRSWFNHGPCLQVCWSQSKDHNHIFASFSRGWIGIWNVNDGVNVSRTIVDGVPHYLPLNYFCLGEQYPNHLCVHYDLLGPRWLAVIVMYRNLLVFDIRDLTAPICILNELLRNVVRVMDWSPIWEPIAVGLCNSFLNYGKHFIAVNPLSVIFSQHKVETMASAVTQLHYSPHRNIYCCGGDNGDVLLLNIKELSRDHPLGNTFGDRRCLSITELRLVENNEVIDSKMNDSSSDKDISLSKDDYYLVFGPMISLASCRQNIFEYNKHRTIPFHLAHMISISAIRYNHNFRGKNLVAVGYSNGLLRIFNTSSHFTDVRSAKK